jgi:hypothetical protein
LRLELPLLLTVGSFCGAVGGLLNFEGFLELMPVAAKVLAFFSLPV